MSSFIHKYTSCNLGNVLTIRCNTLFEAIYVVKNPKKIYSDPLMKWNLSSCKDTNSNHISGINFYKSKLGCQTLSNPKLLEMDSHKSAKTYLNRIRVQVLDESNDIVNENRKESSKYVIFKKAKWYAVIMMDKGKMKPDEMKKLEEDFEKHMTVVEKNTQKAKDKSSSYVDLISEFLQKNPKNLERIQMYEKSAQNKLDNKLRKEYLQNHADKRFKNIEKNFETEKYKNWYINKLNKLYNQEGGVDKEERRRKFKMLLDENIIKMKRQKALELKRKEQRQNALEQTRFFNSNPIITEVLFENFIDKVFSTDYERINKIFRDIDREIYYFANRFVNNVSGMELAYGIHGNVYQSNQQNRVLTPQSSVFSPQRPSMHVVGGSSEIEREKLIFKIYNDFYHDFSSTRNDYNAENRDFTEFGVFNRVPHVKEDAFMRTIIEEMDPIKYKQFTFDNRDYNTNRNNFVVDALKEYKQNHNNNNELYIIEDMGIPHQIKNPDSLPLLNSKNTYTNILDPITVIDDNGNTSKTNNMIYDIYDINNINYNFDYQESVNGFITEFFQALNSAETWNLTKFKVPLEYLRNQPIDDEEPRFPHFKIEIYFNGATETDELVNNPNIIKFNVYGGMFSVPRINQFIAYITPTGKKKFKPKILKNNEKKMWKALNVFYNKLKLSFNDNNAHKRAILFIQMMKALGDHAQIKEFELMSKMYQGGFNKSLVFGSRDRIIVAEALRFDLPVVFEFKAVDNKFPKSLLDEEKNKLLKDFFETNETHKVFLYNPYDQAAEVDIGNILFKNEVINDNISFEFSMKELKLTDINSESNMNEYLSDIRNKIQSSLKDDFLKSFNQNLIKDFIDMLRFYHNALVKETIPIKDTVNQYLRRTLMFNRAKQIVINLIENDEYIPTLSDKINVYTKLVRKVFDQSTGFKRMVNQQLMSESRRITKSRINNLDTFGSRIFKDLKKINDIIGEYLKFDFESENIARKMFVSDQIIKDPKYREFIDILKTYYNQNRNTFNGKFIAKQIESQRKIRAEQDELENIMLTIRNHSTN